MPTAGWSPEHLPCSRPCFDECPFPWCSVLDVPISSKRRSRQDALDRVALLQLLLCHPRVNPLWQDDQGRTFLFFAGLTLSYIAICAAPQFLRTLVNATYLPPALLNHQVTPVAQHLWSARCYMVQGSGPWQAAIAMLTCVRNLPSGLQDAAGNTVLHAVALQDLPWAGFGSNSSFYEAILQALVSAGADSRHAVALAPPP